jgi:hypothetical protein
MQLLEAANANTNEQFPANDDPMHGTQDVPAVPGEAVSENADAPPGELLPVSRRSLQHRP